MNTKKGRVTVPTDVDVIEETLNIIERWGADAIRDCDGTSMPEQLRELDVKQYATYYTTRKDNAWASANPVSYTHLDVYKRQELQGLL